METFICAAIIFGIFEFSMWFVHSKPKRLSNERHIACEKLNYVLANGVGTKLQKRHRP